MPARAGPGPAAGRKALAMNLHFATEQSGASDGAGGSNARALMRKRKTVILAGRVTLLEEVGRPAFHLRVAGRTIYCLLTGARPACPRPGASVAVTGNWSRAVNGYFEVDRVETIAERKGAGHRR